MWYLIFVAFAATALILSVIRRSAGPAVQRRGQTNVQLFTDNAWYALVVIMSQGIQCLANIFFLLNIFHANYIKNNRLITGGHMPSSRLSMRFAAGSWCLIAFVLVYAYNSTLVSYISLSKYEPVVNTWDDLAASTSLRVTAPRGSISAEIILVRRDFLKCFFILNSKGLNVFCHFL